MNEKITIQVPFTDLSIQDVDDLLDLALRRGFLRVEPRNAWSLDEKKAAIRWYVQSLALTALNERQQRKREGDF